MRESSHRGDALLGQVVLGGGVVHHLLSILDMDTFSDSVNLLVHLGPVVVTLLTGTCHGELNT